jgi:uncharacterized heparinase superfamily protein
VSENTADPRLDQYMSMVANAENGDWHELVEELDAMVSFLKTYAKESAEQEDYATANCLIMMADLAAIIGFGYVARATNKGKPRKHRKP